MNTLTHIGYFLIFWALVIGFVVWTFRAIVNSPHVPQTPTEAWCRHEWPNYDGETVHRCALLKTSHGKFHECACGRRLGPGWTRP